MSSPLPLRTSTTSSSMISVTPHSTDEVEDVVHPLDMGLPPLMEELYPRKIKERGVGKGFYVALGLVMAVWMITPLSCAYLVWYVLIGQGLGAYAGLTANIFAAYALTEVVFAIYMSYLVQFVQKPSPPSTLPMAKRNELFHRVLGADLAYPTPYRPRAKEGDVERNMEKELWKMYETGQLTAGEYHHVVDRKYEEMHGMQVKRRVGKLTETQKNVISAFVEESEGEREERLRREIEGDVGYGQDDFEEGIVARDGSLVPLHHMDRRAVEFRERLRTWFNHAPWESIKRQNMLIWLSWACFSTSYEETREDKEHSEFLETSLAMLEARTGTTFEEGFDPKVEIIRLSLDTVNARGRPLILYALTCAINWWLRAVVYPYYGMGLYKEGEIEYLVRIPTGWTAEKARVDTKATPIIYMHGLGFGLLQNHLLIQKLLTTLSTHPVVVPLAPHTSQSIFHPRHLRPWTREELVSTMKKICIKWGFWEDGGEKGRAKGGVTMLSHSNGSIAHSWVLKDCPSLIKRNTFVDPVCFVLWEGDICHSFCYRTPKTALEVLLYYFIGAEVGIANYIQRNFDWADNNLFAEEIPGLKDPSRTAFFFGAQDIIIDAARARKYLERHGVRNGLHWDENGGHGDGLAGEALKRVINYVGTGSAMGWAA